jgi:hypothetical protein
MEHWIDSDWMCFHKPTGTPERIQQTVRVKVTELVSTFDTTKVETLPESQMTRYKALELDAPSQNSVNDTTTIHFCPENISQRQLL